MEDSSKKEEFVFDTSALISLATINLIDKILGFAQVIVTPSVLKEVEEFAKFSDNYGKAGKEILKYEENFTVIKPYIKENIKFIGKADNELYNLAKEKRLPLITDDIKLSRHTDGKIETQFSVYFVIALVASGAMPNEEALALLEMLRDLRNWRSNIIYVLARKELERL